MCIVLTYAAEVEFSDAVVELPHQAHHVTDLAVTEPKGGRRKTVSDVTVNSVVISCKFSAYMNLELPHLFSIIIA